MNRLKGLFSAETKIFGRKSNLRPKISCFGPIRPTKIEDGLSNDPYMLRPKMANFGRKSLTAEISVTEEFRIPQSISYGYGVSAKIPFRSHTSLVETSSAHRSPCTLENAIEFCSHLRVAPSTRSETDLRGRIDRDHHARGSGAGRCHGGDIFAGGADIARGRKKVKLLPSISSLL